MQIIRGLSVRVTVPTGPAGSGHGRAAAARARREGSLPLFAGLAGRAPSPWQAARRSAAGSVGLAELLVRAGMTAGVTVTQSDSDSTAVACQ